MGNVNSTGGVSSRGRKAHFFFVVAEGSAETIPRKRIEAIDEANFMMMVLLVDFLVNQTTKTKTSNKVNVPEIWNRRSLDEINKIFRRPSVLVSAKEDLIAPIRTSSIDTADCTLSIY